jgi:pimeloyl-ACP methyl ester carboxylesterase
MPETRTVRIDPDLNLALDDGGSGRPTLVLHGGGGPATVSGVADHLAETMHVLTPTHPGWNGNERPDRITTIVDLAVAYLRLLAIENLHDVIVVGSSIGGWLAAEMAVRDRDRRISGLVLIDAVGVQIEGAPIRDFFALDPRGVAEYSFHDAERFYVDPATVPDEQMARQRANIATMRELAGDPYMHDPDLLGQLATVDVPTLLIWGSSDRIVTPEYGQAMADAFANARFTIIPDAGHLPQLEQASATFEALDSFIASVSRSERP